MKALYQQLGQLWSQLGLNQRVSIVLAMLGVVGGMAGIYFWSSRPQMQLLYGKMNEKDAAEVIAAVQAANIPYEVGAGGTSVYVQKDQVYKLRMDLAGKGLPSGDGVGFEIFDKGNFGISDFVQHTNYTRALQGELARTISKVNGVNAARVMIVLPESKLLLVDPKSKPTASVFIDVAGGKISIEAVNSIRHLVANSVEGLSPDDVAVVDNRGTILSENLKDDPTVGLASSQVRYRKSVEDYLSTKVESMLASVLGANNAVVRVSADIDTEGATTTEEKYDPDGSVLRTLTSTDDSTLTSEKGEDGSSGGPAGTASNVPASGAGDGDNGTAKTSEQVRKNKSQTFEINRSTTSVIKNPGTVRDVTAAVFIALRSTVSGTQSTPNPRSPEEIESLRQMVVNALGVKAPDGADVSKLVSVQEVPFQAPIIPPAGGMENSLFNTVEIVRNLAAAGIAVFIFLFFLRMLKKSKPEDIPMEILNGTPALMAGSAGSFRAGEGGGDITPEMLNDLIRQKPANVGMALKNYMSPKS